MKEVIDVVCQPKVMTMAGAVTMIIGGAIRNEELCTAGLIIVGLAFMWAFAKAIKDAG